MLVVCHKRQIKVDFSFPEDNLSAKVTTMYVFAICKVYDNYCSKDVRANIIECH